MLSGLLDPALHIDSSQNPVLPGDHPDPTIIRVGEEYWASATSGEWSPQFPLFHSTDLVRWTPEGAVFPVQPEWAEGSFWAPELVEDGGRFLIYYVAKARGGPLTVAVATADAPGGPWLDCGPVHTEPLGAIDPAFARDEHGHPYLIWKTDGNSVEEATPIWAQPLSDDLLHLVGEKTLLITNDQPWEEGVVEGPFVLRHASRFYLFYAGNTCCGRKCRYAEGVARADHLLGPWEKMPNNPLIGANDAWHCPGHGTAFHRTATNGTQGQDYLLYHAYPASGAVYVGRQAMMDAIDWGPDDWPRVNAGRGPGGAETKGRIEFVDTFTGGRLGASWQWPVNTRPALITGYLTEGEPSLCLRIPAGRQSALVAVPLPGSPQFQASVSLRRMSGVVMVEEHQPDTPQYNPPPVDLWAGLAVVGDAFNTAGLGLREDTVEVCIRRGSWSDVAWSQRLPELPERLWMRMTSTSEAQLQFAYSLDGHVWVQAGQPVDGSDLPSWDQGLRLGLMMEGPEGSTMGYRDFALHSLEAGQR